MARVFILILGMAIVTYLPRFLPMYILTRLEIPQVVSTWLRYIPVAVLAALIVPGILAVNGHITVSPNNYYLLASFLAFGVAYRFRNMMLTVTVGMAAVLILQNLW
ncbi:MAG TPA: AzlD domain-containing protein [Oscillospiraceae bacterium]|nr:AzlD domain-containing protein [Oscillospiraceae bacterium]